MRNHLSFIMDYLDFPTEAQKELLAAYDVICANPKSEAILTKWVNTYEENIHLPYETAIREMEEAVSPAVLSMTGSLNESSDRFPGIPAVHPYTADLLLFLCLTRRLKALYDARGLSEQIYRDSCLDLTWKLNECHKMYGIWGTFVPWWEPGFYEMTRFALGRLQFELVPFPESYEASGRHKPDTMTQAINVHIPSCGRLRMEECHASYRTAAAFFADAFPGEEVAFTCHSWMLFPPHREFLQPNSGVVRFMNEYDIFATGEDNGDLWRIFQREYDGDADALPEVTRMQKGYKNWLKQGHHAGYGHGIFFYRKTL